MLPHREGRPKELVDSLIGGDGAEGAGKLQLMECWMGRDRGDPRKLHRVPLQHWRGSHQRLHVRRLPEAREKPRKGLSGIEHGAYLGMTIVSVPTSQPGKLTTQRALCLLL